MTSLPNIDALREEFLSEFEDPNGILFLDPDREDVYEWAGYTKWSTEDAVERVFANRLTMAELDLLANELNTTAPYWVARDEI